MKILLLNPQIDAEHKVATFLSSKGMAVLHPIDATEAWQMLQLHGSTIDLGIFHLPENASLSKKTLKLLDKIKADPGQSDLPYILTTTTWNPKQCAAHQNSLPGANAYLPSPFDEKQLFAMIEAVLGPIRPEDLLKAQTPVSPPQSQNSKEKGKKSGPPEPSAPMIGEQALRSGQVVLVSTNDVHMIKDQAPHADDPSISLEDPTLFKALEPPGSGDSDAPPPMENTGISGSSLSLAELPASASAADDELSQEQEEGPPDTGLSVAAPTNSSSPAAAASLISTLPEMKFDDAEAAPPEAPSNATRLSPALEVSPSNETPNSIESTFAQAQAAQTSTQNAAPLPSFSASDFQDEPPVASSTAETKLLPSIESAPEASEDLESQKEMPYLYQKPKTKNNGSEAHVSPSAQNPALIFASPLGDAVIPGGAAQSPDLETLKKYLLLREQDVAVLSRQLKDAKDQIGVLEKAIHEENAKNTDLKNTVEAQQQKIDEAEKEKAIEVEKLQGEIQDLHFQLKSKVDRARILETQVREITDDMDRLKDRVRLDIRKIRVKEKELENRLEIMKKDSEALISARETKIIELKRKLDLLEFNMDLLQDQYSKEKDHTLHLRERLEKAAQIVRAAGGLLDTPKSGTNSEGSEGNLSEKKVS